MNSLSRHTEFKKKKRATNPLLLGAEAKYQTSAPTNKHLPNTTSWTLPTHPLSTPSTLVVKMMRSLRPANLHVPGVTFQDKWQVQGGNKVSKQGCMHRKQKNSNPTQRCERTCLQLQAGTPIEEVLTLLMTTLKRLSSLQVMDER